MRNAYLGGSTGALCSATAWFAAGLATMFHSPKAGIITLLIGGMVIFPASVVLSKILGHTGKHASDNPLAPLAIYGTIWMLVSIPIAIGASLYRIEWFFPAMLLIIGGRYMTFDTLYGNKTYLVFGATLAITAIILSVLQAAPAYGAFGGAVIEYAFGFFVFIQSREGHAHDESDSSNP